MNARLISITEPVQALKDVGVKTADDLIAYCARVSNPSNQLNTETAPRLIAYCIKHGHWSVFETVSMTLEIVTSRAIAAQLLRHRSFTFQEFSQRYATATEIEEVELRTQDEKNRQGSGSVIDPLSVYYSDVKYAIRSAKNVYDSLIEKGVSKETARMVLPLCTKTTLYMTGSARSWIHYFEQRCSEGTQKEHRELALRAKSIFDVKFPSVAKALNETP